MNEEKKTILDPKSEEYQRRARASRCTRRDALESAGGETSKRK